MIPKIVINKKTLKPTSHFSRNFEMSGASSVDMAQQRMPKFHLRALNVFTKIVTLFVSDDVVHWEFDTSKNTIVMKALCQSNQAMLLCELTGTGKPGDIMGNIRHADGKVHKYKFDSKAIQLLVKHVNKASAVSMVIDVDDAKLCITTKDNKNQPLTQHVLRSIDDGKTEEDLDIAEMVSGLEYPVEATVNGKRFSRCMGVSCDETSVEISNNVLRFSTDHTALKTTMLLPLSGVTGNVDYSTQFGKVATSWLAKVSGVCAFATKVHKAVMKHHLSAQRKKKRKRDEDKQEEEEEEAQDDEEDELQLKLFLSSTLPLGLHGSMGNASSLRVYASSRNDDDRDDEDEEEE
jgi:hypothetical protein